MAGAEQRTAAQAHTAADGQARQARHTTGYIEACTRLSHYSWAHGP